MIVRGRHERAVARGLALDLQLRGFAVGEAEPNVEASLDPALIGTDVVSVVLVPYEPTDPRKGDRSLDHLDQVSRRGRAPIVIGDVNDRRINHLAARVHGIIRFGEGYADHDTVFEQLFKTLVGPFPRWLDVRVRPSLISAPTGLSWWSDELLVADEHYGQVVLVSAGATKVVVDGLSEPHHVHVDKSSLLVANRGDHSLIIACLEAGSAKDIRAVGGLRHPSGVHQSHGVTAIADTDNHRVVLTDRDPTAAAASRWRPASVRGGLRYPGAVDGNGLWIWVADTFHHRLVVLDHAGRQVRDFNGYGLEPGRFAYPVGLASWRRRLFVADAEPQRIQAFGVDPGDRHLQPSLYELGDGRLGHPWIGSPFALAVNRHGRLAVSDRLRRCVWLIDLPEALGSDGFGRPPARPLRDAA